MDLQGKLVTRLPAGGLLGELGLLLSLTQPGHSVISLRLSPDF